MTKVKFALVVLTAAILTGTLTSPCLSTDWWAAPEYLVEQVDEQGYPLVVKPTCAAVWLGSQWRFSFDQDHPVYIPANTLLTYRICYYSGSAVTGVVTDTDTWSDPAEYDDFVESWWDFDNDGQSDGSTKYHYAQITHRYTTAGPQVISWKIKDSYEMDGVEHVDANDLSGLPADDPDRPEWDAKGVTYVFVDSSAPTTPVVYDGDQAEDIDYTNSTTELRAKWTSADAESGIKDYTYWVTNSSGQTVKSGSQRPPSENPIIVTGTFQPGETYRFHVRTRNNALMLSGEGVSDGVTIDTVPPVVTITTPPDDQVFKAPGATSVTIGGEASDADTMVVSVDVKIGSGQWQAATYDSVTHNWSFVWQNPEATTITARATDFAGNCATVSRDVSVVTYDTNWLTMSAYATRFDEVQASWTYPNPVSTLKYAVGTAPCRDDIYPWTATESPTATQVTVSDLDLEDNTTYYFSLKGLDASGNLDRIGSCSFVVDLGADSIELEASPSTSRETGDSVTVTATLTDCRDNVIGGRSITFETMGVHDSTTTATTNSSGQASVTFTCIDEGWVNVSAHEYQPSLANVEESIDIEFKKPPLIEVLFVMEGNVAGSYNDLARDAILELESLSDWYQVPIKFGGLSFDDLPCTHLHPFTDDYFDFNDWLWEIADTDCYLCVRNAFAWEGLGALAQASAIFDQETTHKYIAVVSNDKYLRCGEEPSSWYDYCYTPGGCYDKPSVIQILQNAGCKVYVDQWNLTGDTYDDLAVNGDVENPGAWPFPKMLTAVENDIDEILNPTPPQYDPGTCDPLYVNEGGSEEMSLLSETPASVVLAIISTNGDLEPVASKRYPCYSSDPNLGQHQDREVSVRFNLQASRKYRFIVRDLADESPYAKRQGDKKADGDNYPTGTGEYGSLDCTSDPNHEHHGRVVYATTDSQGKATLTLTVTNRYGGNNYRIDVTPVINSKQILAQSPVIVAWKRVYLELDRMYRKGAYLAAEVHSGAQGVKVEDIGQFSVGNTIRIFDLDHPNGEERTIVQITPDSIQPLGILLLDSPLANDYPLGETTFVGVSNTLYYIDIGWSGDAYGSANATFTQPQRVSSNLVRTKEDVITGKERGGFVDLRPVPLERNPHRYIPHIDAVAGVGGGGILNDRYFDQVAEADVIHVMAIDESSTDDYGLSDSQNNWSAVCVGECSEDRDPLTDPDRRFVEQCLAHELGHQFNPFAYVDCNHPDALKLWIDPSHTSEECLMHIHGENVPQYSLGTGVYCEMCGHCLKRIRECPLDLGQVP